MHCDASLKFHSLTVGMLFLLTGMAILMPYAYFGFSGWIILNALVCLAVFSGIIWFTPLEVCPDDKRGE